MRAAREAEALLGGLPRSTEPWTPALQGREAHNMEVPHLHPHFRPGKLSPREEKRVASGHTMAGDRVETGTRADSQTSEPSASWAAAEALESRGLAGPPWDPPVTQRRQER